MTDENHKSIDEKRGGSRVLTLKDTQTAIEDAIGSVGKMSWDGDIPKKTIAKGTAIGVVAALDAIERRNENSRS